MLKKEILVSCQKVSEKTQDMDVEENTKWFGAVITNLKRDNEDIHAIVDLGTTLEEAAERKSVFEDFAMQLEEMEQEAKQVTDATT